MSEQEVSIEFGSARIETIDGKAIHLSRRSGGRLTVMMIDFKKTTHDERYRPMEITTKAQFDKLWALLEQMLKEQQ